jgi:hypothetical protein
VVEIGVQAAQLILDSPNALTTLKQLSQDFPKYTASLARRVVPKVELREEVRHNSLKAQPGLSAVWLNGASVPETKMNPFSYVCSFCTPDSLVQSPQAFEVAAERDGDDFVVDVYGLDCKTGGQLGFS